MVPLDRKGGSRKVEEVKFIDPKNSHDITI